MASWENDPVVDDLTITSKDLDAVRHVESRGNPNAVSPKGAVGPYQFMPATYEGMGLTRADAMDETKARPAAQKMLQDLTNKYGSKEKALAAYNWGQGNLDKHGLENAPTETKNYIKQVTAHAAGGTAAEVKKPWESDPVITEEVEKSPVSGLVGNMAPSKTSAAIDIAKRTVGEVASFADMITALPGAAAGLGADIMTRVQGAVRGEDRKIVAKAGQMLGEDIAEPSSHLITDAVRKVMRLAGYGDDSQYTQTEVNNVMEKIGGAIGKGGEWVEKQTHGLLLKEDVQALTNEVMILGGAHGVKAGVKGVVAKMGETKAPAGAITKPSGDIPTLREDPTSDKPVAKPTNLPPNVRAKMDIEQTLNIKDPVEQAKVFKQNRADARAAFKDAPQYADYLQRYADEEVRQRDVAAQQADVIAQAKAKINPAVAAVEEATPVTWNQALPIYKTPGFLRTPEQLIKLRQFERQGGKADPETLAYMAGAGLAIVGGIALDPEHPIEGAAIGMAALLAAKPVGKAVISTAKSVMAAKSISGAFKPDERLHIDDIANQHEVAVAQSSRAIWQQQSEVIGLSKDPVRRAAITKWMQGDKSVPLTDPEYAAALKAKNFFAEMGKAGQDSGVLTNLIDDYVTNLWDLNGTNKATFDRISNGMSPNSRFNLQRSISSLEEGKKLGLKPVTEDIATIMGIYGNSLARTMANRKLLDSLKAAEISDTNGQRLMMTTGDMPKTYVNGSSIHPQLSGYGVHPDIAPSMRFLFAAKSPSIVMAGLEMVNMASKRMAVSFSLFHAKALLDAYIGAGGNPLKVGKMAMGTSDYLKMVKEGGAGDLVDTAQLGGLKFSFDKGSLADEDIKGNFYEGLDKLHQIANEKIPLAGTAIKGIEKINQGVDELMWNRLHAGMKLEIFSKNYEVLKENNIKAHAKNPEVALKTREELAKISASYTNDIFGGLNWRRVAEEANTKWGRDLSMEVMSPTGRRMLQLATFAPDWTLSTTRAALKAFSKGSGVKGLFNPTELGDLHRQYILRSALYYFTVGNALNYAMSGHAIWDNKDPTTLELGDGRTMQFSKHMMEPVHWGVKPLQQTANKLGILPKEFITQVTGKEYISTTGKAPPMDTSLAGRARHIVKGALPISTSGEGSLETAVSSSLGFPIYGKTAAQKEQEKADKAFKKRLKQGF